MKVAISGSNGFIGSALKLFLESKHFIVYPITQLELASQELLKKNLTEFKPDYIFHLASYGNHNFQKNEQEVFNANIVKTFNLLRATIDIKYRAFVNFGSSSEYGKYDIPMIETLLPLTTSFYGASKVATTYLSRAFASEYNKPIVTVRPFSVYGPREADFRFIPTVIRSIINNEEFLLDIEAKHDWIYIDDFIGALMAIVLNINQLKSGVINIGTGSQYTNLEVVNTIEDVIGKLSRFKLIEGIRKNDSKNWVADTFFLSSGGWKPKYSLEQGLAETYKYYKKKYSIKIS